MALLLDLLLLLLLFVILGISADFVVKNIKYIASVLRIKLFAFGILLGLVTTLPELSVGINAAINEASSLSVGNLLSGVIVILGLILGASLLLNRDVATDGRWSVLIPQVAIIFSLILLGLDGSYGLIDGLIMVGFYCGLIYYLYRINQAPEISYPELINKNKILKAFLASVLGVVAILLASNGIIKIILDLLNYVNISKLVVGALVFAIGTNLPEITITITSWRKKASELSLSHLLSSAFTNVLVLGILAVIRPIVFEVDISFWVIAVFLSLILVLFLVFYRSGKKMDRREGLALLMVYVVFLFVNIWLLK